MGLWAPASLFAQAGEYLGPTKCARCHKDEAAWWERKDGPPPRGHVNALKLIETPKSATFAKAIGLADMFDPKGACTECHATVFKGEANAGVSCERCHGPGSGYVDLHVEPDSHSKAVAAGMADLVGKPNNWAGVCLRCHITTDGRLLSAGHPSGDTFDLAATFSIVAPHWKNEYTRVAVAAIARQQAAPLLAKRVAAAVPAPARPAPAATPGPTHPNAPATPVTGPVVTAPAPPSEPAATLPQSPVAAVAALQGRVVGLVDSLLRRSEPVPIRVTTPSTTKAVYRGADAELIRLQQDVLALALEVLSTTPSNAPDQKK